MKIVRFFFVLCIVSFASSKAFSLEHTFQYITFVWPSDARALALGHGLIVTGDGSYHESTINPALTASRERLYASGSAHLSLIDDYDIVLASSTVLSSYSFMSRPMQDEKFQKLMIGGHLFAGLSLQCTYVRTYVSPEYNLYGVVGYREGLPGHIDVKASVVGFSVAYQLGSHASIGLSSNRYRVSQQSFFQQKGTEYSADGWSFDTGIEVTGVLPQLTMLTGRSSEKRFYNKFRTRERRGLSAGLVFRQVGPEMDLKSPKILFWIEGDVVHFKQYWDDLPTELRASISYMAMQTDELSIELLAGYGQNFRGAYEDDLFRWNTVDYAFGGELELLNLARFRSTYLRFDLRNAISWGFGLGPRFAQLEFASVADVNSEDLNWSFADGRKIVSLRVSWPLR